MPKNSPSVRLPCVSPSTQLSSWSMPTLTPGILGLSTTEGSNARGANPALHMPLPLSTAMGRSQSANKRSNSLGSQQKERTNANSLFDPIVMMKKVMVTMMMHAYLAIFFSEDPIITGPLVCHLCEDVTFVYDATNRKSTPARTSTAGECSS